MMGFWTTGVTTLMTGVTVKVGGVFSGVMVTSIVFWTVAFGLSGVGAGRLMGIGTIVGVPTGRLLGVGDVSPGCPGDGGLGGGEPGGGGAVCCGFALGDGV